MDQTCQFCGAEVPDVAKYCVRCGHSLLVTPAMPGQQASPAATRDTERAATPTLGALRPTKMGKGGLFLIGMVVVVIGAFIVKLIGESNDDAKFKVYSALTRILPGSIRLEGIIAKDDVWTNGVAEFPSFSDATISSHGGSTYQISADFYINYHNKKLPNHFICQIEELGESLLSGESPEQMAPSGAGRATHLRYTCGESGSGKYEQCYYWDLKEVKFSVQPIPGNTISETRLKSLTIGNTVIRFRDLADDVFPIIARYKTDSPKVLTDPVNPSSMAVTHYYKVHGKPYAVEFRRSATDGPYRVFDIRAREH